MKKATTLAFLAALSASSAAMAQQSPDFQIVSPNRGWNETTYTLAKRPTSESGTAQIFVCPKGSANMYYAGETAFDRKAGTFEMKVEGRLNPSVTFVVWIKPEGKNMYAMTQPWDFVQNARTGATGIVPKEITCLELKNRHQ